MQRPNLSLTPLSIATQRQTVRRTLLSGTFLATALLGVNSACGQGLNPSGVTEDTDSYTTGVTSSATKLPLSIRETPQSVTVITRQQMDDQGDLTIGDVLRNAPGVTAQAYDSDRMEYSTRGYAITNFQHDGVNSLYDSFFDEGATKVDMAL